MGSTLPSYDIDVQPPPELAQLRELTISVSDVQISLLLPDTREYEDLISVARRNGLHEPGVVPFREPTGDTPDDWERFVRETAEKAWASFEDLKGDTVVPFVIKHNGNVVGAFLGCAKETFFDLEHMEIQRFWTAPNVQGSGIGTKAVSAFGEFAFQDRNYSDG